MIMNLWVGDEMVKMPKRQKCPNCKYKLGWEGFLEPLACNRLYVKHKNKWLAIGWICPNCGWHQINQDKIPFKQYSTVDTGSQEVY